MACTLYSTEYQSQEPAYGIRPAQHDQGGIRLACILKQAQEHSNGIVRKLTHWYMADGLYPRLTEVVGLLLQRQSLLELSRIRKD